MKFAGIDIAKREHWMAVVDAEGRAVLPPTAYANDSEGLAAMVADLASLGGEVEAAMESTGCYWRSCHRALSLAGIPVAVMNPVRTCAARKSSNLGRAKTDAVDCLVIADFARRERPAPTVSPDGDLAQLRELARLRRSLSGDAARCKLRLTALLDQVWPEFARLFADRFCGSALASLRWLSEGSGDLDSLADALGGASRGRFGSAKASEVAASLSSTCGVPASPAHLLELRLLLGQLDFSAAQIAEADAAMAPLLESAAPTLRTVPGIGPALACQIAAEVGDASRFESPGKLVALAGLDPARFQSGGFESERTRISKRGSAYLRRSLYIAAQAALRSDCEFRDFYDRLRARGKSHRCAVCAVARKMLCVVWALMRSGEEYSRERHSAKGEAPEGASPVEVG
ncbi:IS110 family RNA-guided transposase [Adlercreutzia mucosicola]|uniref:IS110 family transposase n=1 Tax=Adlercreutzia mucosicola TaxID=580026 RepID=UPI00041947C6|nr:IS110 family transposase [Adlercreutzia mucosicola]MCR2035894.1 IS110 family transposase [Adlercreutzia mucosicola]